MFHRKLMKEIYQRLDGTNSSLQDVRGALSNRVAVESLVDCDDCGCLLRKDKKFKQPSTVEVRDIEIVGFSGVAAPGHHIWAIEKKEVIVEHYKCFKCHPFDPLTTIKER